MKFFGNLFSGGAATLVDSVGAAIDRNVTSDQERLAEKANIESTRLNYVQSRDSQDRDLSLAQNQTNLQSLQHTSLFVAGWRPAIGWVGAIALAYQFVLYPLLLWLPVAVPPEPFDAMQLVPIITGMLGIAGLRSIDKFNRVDTR